MSRRRGQQISLQITTVDVVSNLLCLYYSYLPPQLSFLLSASSLACCYDSLTEAQNRRNLKMPLQADATLELGTVVKKGPLLMLNQT